MSRPSANYTAARSDEQHYIYGYAAWMRTWEPNEYARALKGWPPSDGFKTRSTQKVARNWSDGSFRLASCPVSLHTRSGQEALVKAVRRVETMIGLIPQQAAYEADHMDDVLKTFRKLVGRDYARMIMTAILHRCAAERKIQVIFAYESIRTWVRTVYGVDLELAQIRRTLMALQKREWARIDFAEPNYHGKATKIRVNLDPERIVDVAAADEWLLRHDHAMMAVYRRETTAKATNMADRAVRDAEYHAQTTAAWEAVHAGLVRS